MGKTATAFKDIGKACSGGPDCPPAPLQCSAGARGGWGDRAGTLLPQTDARGVRGRGNIVQPSPTPRALTAPTPRGCADLLTKDYKVGKSTVEVKSKTSNGVVRAQPACPPPRRTGAASPLRCSRAASPRAALTTLARTRPLARCLPTPARRAADLHAGGHQDGRQVHRQPGSQVRLRRRHRERGEAAHQRRRRGDD